MKGQPAPELNIVQWFNTTRPLDLKSLRGKVVVLHAFSNALLLAEKNSGQEAAQ